MTTTLYYEKSKSPSISDQICTIYWLVMRVQGYIKQGRDDCKFEVLST
jgi:hypothetical protein